MRHAIEPHATYRGTYNMITENEACGLSVLLLRAEGFLTCHEVWLVEADAPQPKVVYVAIPESGPSFVLSAFPKEWQAFRAWPDDAITTQVGAMLWAVNVAADEIELEEAACAAP